MRLRVHHIRVPFRFEYGHAKKKHRDLAAVVCVASDDEGRQGLGEAVPRAYVTGESCASVLATLPELARRVRIDGSPAELAADRLALATAHGADFPSCALAAIDTALTDLRARQRGVPLHEYLGGAKACPLAYSGSIGISKPTKLVATALVYRLLGLRIVKVKVGDAEDIARMRFLRRLLGPEVRLFADANGQWDRDEAARNIEALAREGVWAIEEPLRGPEATMDHQGRVLRGAAMDDAHYARCAWLRERSPIPIIADESLIDPASLERILEHQAFDIANIRLSKCGGPLLGGAMVERVRAAGMRFALGAMVGETPVLATAGTHFGVTHPEHLYIQGHSHRLLHARRFVHGEPAMGRGGGMLPKPAPGLGLRVDTRALEALTLAHGEVAL